MKSSISFGQNPFVDADAIRAGEHHYEKALDILNNKGSVSKACELLNQALSLGIGEAGYKLFVLHTQGCYLKDGDKEVGEIVMRAADAVKPSGKAKKIVGIRLTNQGMIKEAEIYLIAARDMGVEDTARHIAAMKTHQPGMTLNERCMDALNYLVLHSDVDTDKLRDTYIQLASKLGEGYENKLH